MPVPIIALIALAALSFTVVTVVVLNWSNITTWFESWNKNNLTTKDKDDIGFTLTKKIEQNQFKTIQGVFNTKDEKVKDGRVILSKEVHENLIDNDAQEDNDGTLLIFD